MYRKNTGLENVIYRALIGFLWVVFAPLAQANNTQCSVLLEGIDRWPESSVAYVQTARKYMDPHIRDKLDGVNTQRKISKTLARKIANLYYHMLVTACRESPDKYTYTASKQAAQETRALVQEYLGDRG
ncbi:MAG: hypothetical protein V7629_00945 [Motiliproteus sp.]